MTDLLEERLRAEEWNRKISMFAAAKDEAGNPAHPHLERVAEAMDWMLAKDPSMSLEDAYTNACYSVPELREQMAKARFEKEAAAKAREAEVAKAKKAQGVRSTDKSANANKKENWEAVLDAGIEALGGEE